jgi:peptidoglycan-associated lipoprotein
MFAGTTIPAMPSPSAFGESAALRDIHFDFDQYRIRPEAGRALENNARWLKAHGNAVLLIEGHADERGTNEYNLALAERRAGAARDYLIALGVARTRINVVSYGEERPVCSDRTESCWAQNRRAHFLVRQ